MVFPEKLKAWLVCFLKARLMHVQQASHQTAVKPSGTRMAERDMSVFYFWFVNEYLWQKISMGPVGNLGDVDLGGLVFWPVWHWMKLNKCFHILAAWPEAIET